MRVRLEEARAAGPRTFLAEAANRNPRLLPAHDKIWVVLRHRSGSAVDLPASSLLPGGGPLSSADWWVIELSRLYQGLAISFYSLTFSGDRKAVIARAE